MTHNIFHLDGKGMLRHLDRILEVPEIAAIQWVQGVGDDLPILQWLPVIKKIQAAGKGVIVDLQLDELEPFIAAMDPTDCIFASLRRRTSSRIFSSGWRMAHCGRSRLIVYVDGASASFSSWVFAALEATNP